MQLAVGSSQVMQNSMPQEFSSMTEQRHHHQHDDEPLHCGSKRSSPPTVQSDDDLLFPPSTPTSGRDQIVQTTKSKGIVNVQLFIRKAFAMINECDPNIACWTNEGDKFVVKNKEVFAAQVIPQYYDHNNYSSFTRQLNFYGFTREQSMTIKVTDLNSLAVGQETFYHQHFQRDRPDLLKNLQRRSTDSKNSKKRKKARTDGGADVSFLQGRVEAMEETAKEMLTTMKQMRDDSFVAASAIQNLQNANAVKDRTISALEKRITLLERQIAGSSSGGGLARQETNISNFNPQGLMPFGVPSQPPNEVSFSSAFNAATNGTSNLVGTDSNGAPTLARHPKMKKFFGNPPRDIFSYENATNAGMNNNNNNGNGNGNGLFNQGGVAPARESSLDSIGLLSTLARESTLLSWALPRQDTDKAVNFPSSA